jgi:hypothetical protein
MINQTSLRKLYALILVLSLIFIASGIVMAKPAPSITVDMVTYELGQPESFMDRNTATGISWKNVRPYLITLRLYEYGTDNYLVGGAIGPPKGKEAKYPQNWYCSTASQKTDFETGTLLDVRVVFEDSKNNVIADSGVITTIKWGTASTWTPIP